MEGLVVFFDVLLVLLTLATILKINKDGNKKLVVSLIFYDILGVYVSYCVFNKVETLNAQVAFVAFEVLAIIGTLFPKVEFNKKKKGK